MLTAEQIIKLFGMKPLPGEGGFYVETYRCRERIAQAYLPAGYVGERNFSSAILYLLTPDTFSMLHRLRNDEIFHFYLGDPVTMLRLHPDGSSDVIALGQDIMAGQQVQIAVPSSSWQGCLLNPPGRFALMGTTVAPAFEFDDYEQSDRAELLQQYAARKDLIVQLTRQQ